MKDLKRSSVDLIFFSPEEYVELPILKELERILYPHGNLILTRRVPTEDNDLFFLDVDGLIQAGFLVGRSIIWKFANFAPARVYMGYNHQILLQFTKIEKSTFNLVEKSDIWEIPQLPPQHDRNSKYPDMLYQRIIEIYSNEGDTVLSPDTHFCKKAEELGRKVLCQT